MVVRQTDRAFGYTFAIVFTIIGGVIWWVTETMSLWPFIVAGSFAGIALIIPGLLLPLNRIWALFGHKFGAMNNTLILALFYVLFIVPFGIIMHIFGRDPLKRKLNKCEDTYWSTPPRQLDQTTFKDMY